MRNQVPGFRTLWAEPQTTKQESFAVTPLAAYCTVLRSSQVKTTSETRLSACLPGWLAVCLSPLLSRENAGVYSNVLSLQKGPIATSIPLTLRSPPHRPATSKTEQFGHNPRTGGRCDAKPSCKLKSGRMVMERGPNTPTTKAPSTASSILSWLGTWAAPGVQEEMSPERPGRV